MNFMAKCIYRDGELLSAEEVVDSPIYNGNFILEDEGAIEGNLIVRRARLVDIQNVDVITPLEAAEVVGVSDHQIMVRGHQFNTASRLGLPHKQSWLLRSIGSK
jgi:hypothetical protein